MSEWAPADTDNHSAPVYGWFFCGDTVLTPAVAETIAAVKPAIVILPAGGARLDTGQPLLMTADDIICCIRMAPGQVVVIHLEALDHCPMTRQRLCRHAEQVPICWNSSRPSSR
jgi:hypothetical protein